ncbi:MAG: hypothetical protein OYH77_07935 [Pseudomonadota bacterium]|nr:hypothetical protein [Pseudomonadota bacterium]
MLNRATTMLQFLTSGLPLLLVCFLAVACTPTLETKSLADLPAYDRLLVFYQTAFAKDSAVFDAMVLKVVDAETTRALRDKNIPADKISEIRALQHKLRSFIYYGQIVESLPPKANPKDPKGEGITNVGLRNDFTTLILERVRTFPIQEIAPNDNIVNIEARTIDSVAPHEKQNLYKQIHQESELYVRKAMARFAYYFPFVKADYYKLCNKHKSKNCEGLRTGLDFKFTGEQFKDLNSLTALVNASINKLNRISLGMEKITHKFIYKDEQLLLNPNLTKGLIVTRLNEDSLEIQQYMTTYQYVLLRLADRGVTPIFFTNVFTKKAGAVYLNETADMLGIGDFSYRQLNQVTPTTVMTALTEMQEKSVKHWLDIKQTLDEFEQQKLTISDRKIFKSMLRNDVIVGGLIAKDPQITIPVLYLIDKFQDKREDPPLFISLYKLVETVELLSMAGLFSSMWTGVGMPLFIIPLVAANFAWAGIHSAQAWFDHNRYLALERAVIANTTASMSEVMESLRSARRTRTHAILMGTIGLGMSVPSMSYVLKHIYDGKKVFMIDMAASIFAMPDPVGTVETSEEEQLRRH